MSKTTISKTTVQSIKQWWGRMSKPERELLVVTLYYLDLDKLGITTDPENEDTLIEIKVLNHRTRKIRSECRKLQKENPKTTFQVHYCKRAGEWVIQQANNGEWLCLHDGE